MSSAFVFCLFGVQLLTSSVSLLKPLQEYVLGALSGKTVLLVTHQVDFLPAFDSVLVGIFFSFFFLIFFF
jgi:hypothetical protein